MIPRARNAAGGEAGFTLTELMMTVAIVGVLSAVAIPQFGKDRAAREGREFASELARDLQRSVVQSRTDRLPIRVFFYQDRVEFRSAVPSVTQWGAPTPATRTDPVLRTLFPKPGTTVVDVLPSSATPPGGQVLPVAPGAPKEVEFTISGQTQFTNAALTPVFIYIENTHVPLSHADRRFRIDITPLTSFVALRGLWNY